MSPVLVSVRTTESGYSGTVGTIGSDIVAFAAAGEVVDEEAAGWITEFLDDSGAVRVGGVHTGGPSCVERKIWDVVKAMVMESKRDDQTRCDYILYKIRVVHTFDIPVILRHRRKTFNHKASRFGNDGARADSLGREEERRIHGAEWSTEGYFEDRGR